MTCKKGALLMAAICLLGQGSFAVDLRKAAEKATGQSSEEPVPPPAQRTATAATSSFGTGTYPSSAESFLGSFWSWLVAAPFAYRHEDPSASMNTGEAGGWQGRRSIFPEHVPGEATVPYARVDYNRQQVDSATDADDVRVELGYKALAFHGRSTMYTTDSLNQSLDINQYYGVLRYGGSRPDFVPGTFEVGIGLGISQIKLEDNLGEIKESGGALTFPLKYYPREWLGIELRPAWYTWSKGARVGDYDLSASVGHRFLQLRGGYRWLTTLEINGPYVGVSASF